MTDHGYNELRFKRSKNALPWNIGYKCVLLYNDTIILTRALWTILLRARLPNCDPNYKLVFINLKSTLIHVPYFICMCNTNFKQILTFYFGKMKKFPLHQWNIVCGIQSLWTDLLESIKLHTRKNIMQL